MGSLFGKIKIKGHHNLPKVGPYVIACNHFSDYDPLFFSYAIRKPINFIAASDQEVDIVFVWAPYIYGWIPVDRKNLSPSTIKKALKALKNKEILGIFPDGGVSYNLLSRPKKGAVYLSTVGNCPIVPMSIYGAEKAWEGLFRGIRPRVCINIGKPFGPFKITGSKEGKNKMLTKIGKDMMIRIAALLPNNKQGPYIGNSKIKRYQKENGFIPSRQIGRAHV